MSEQPVPRDRRATDGPPPRRSAVGTAAVTAVLVVAGLLFSTSAQTAKGTPLRAQSADLAALIEAQSAQQQVRVERLAQLQAQYRAESELDSVGSRQLSALSEQVATLEPEAGLTDVTGPGVKVTLNDAPRSAPVPVGAGPDDLVVHQQDVQAVVNALWAGGATAMMLQDQRVISTSAVRCVGNTLILQGRVYSPPYTITAIGDRDRLEAALAASPELNIYKQYVASVGLIYQLERSDRLKLDRYRGPLALTHAKEKS